MVASRNLKTSKFFLILVVVIGFGISANAQPGTASGKIREKLESVNGWRPPAGGNTPNSNPNSGRNDQGNTDTYYTAPSYEEVFREESQQRATDHDEFASQFAAWGEMQKAEEKKREQRENEQKLKDATKQGASGAKRPPVSNPNNQMSLLNIFKTQTINETITDNSYTCQLAQMSDEKFNGMCELFEHNPRFVEAKQKNPNISNYTMYAENEEGDYNLFCDYPNKNNSNSEIKEENKVLNNALRDVAIFVGELGTVPFKDISKEGMFFIANPYYGKIQTHKIKVGDFRHGPGVTKGKAINAQKITKTGANANVLLNVAGGAFTVYDAVVVYGEYTEGKKTWGEASSDVTVIGAKFIIATEVGAAVGGLPGVVAGAVVGLTIEGVYAIGKYYYNNPEALQKLSVFDGSRVYSGASRQ